MVKQDKRRQIEMWCGSRAYFDVLVRSKALKAGRIYFVGDSTGMSDGLSASEVGVIYVATKKDKFVRFGSFTKEEENVGKDITNIYNILEGKTEIHEYEWDGAFPSKGEDCNLYIDAKSGNVYRWDGAKGYTLIGGYTAGDGVTIQGGVISVKVPGVTMEDVVNQIEEFAEAQIETLTANEVWSIWNSIEGHIYM